VFCFQIPCPNLPSIEALELLKRYDIGLICNVCLDRIAVNRPDMISNYFFQNRAAHFWEDIRVAKFRSLLGDKALAFKIAATKNA
jgi:hypothetical protein